MRSIFRYLFKVNRKYDKVREPWRMLIFIMPIFMAGVVGISNHFLFDILFLQFSTNIVFLAMIIFRLPVFFVNEDWANTYITGWPYKFKHSVLVKYSNKEDREEISRWVSKNMKFYRGVFCSSKGAEFYFARRLDAVAFKLRWL